MTDKPLARPRQVTLVGSLILGASVIVVLLAFQHVAQLGSIEAQEEAERLVDQPSVRGLSLSVDGVQTMLRVLSIVAGACAAAAAILAWQVLQRSRSARLALSLLAPVLLVSSIGFAGFAGALVAAATVMLWTQPAKDWFAGVAGRPAPTPQPAPRPAALVPAGPAARAEAPVAPQAPSPPAAVAERAPSRPAAVLVAGLLSIVASVLTLVGSGLALLFAVSSRADYLDLVEEAVSGQAMPEGIGVTEVADVLVALLVVAVAWCLVAIVLAVLAMRGSNAARIALVVSSGGAALASLLGILTVVALALTAAAVATMVLLLRGDVNRWYAARRRS